MIALSLLVLVGLILMLGLAAVVLAFLAILRRSTRSGSQPPRFRSEDMPANAASSLHPSRSFDPAGQAMPDAAFTNPSFLSLDTPASVPPHSSAPPPSIDCSPCSVDPGTGGCDCSGSTSTPAPSGGCE